MKQPSHSPEPPDADAGRDASEAGAAGGSRTIAPGSPAAIAQAYLILGDLIIPLSAARETVIGRDNAVCDVVLADPHVSKSHAVIYSRGERYFIEDLGSLNGVLVNDARVDGAQPLSCRDRILVPPYLLEFAGRTHARISRMMQSHAELSAAPAAGHFAGQLHILNVTDLIQLLNATRQSGILTIVDAERHSAMLAIHRGEILQAQYREFRGAEAVYALLARTDGQFEFIHGAPPIPSRPMQIPTLTLLLEGCRIMDENADHHRETLPRNGFEELPPPGAPLAAAGQRPAIRQPSPTGWVSTPLP
jgi:hypothetical protein